jgi:alpha-N-arabinofuranosidase
MTEPGGGVWLQTIYYPFYYFANYARGTVLACDVSCDTYVCEEFDKVPYLDSLVVWNEAAQEIAVFLVNKSETEAMDVEILLEGFAIKEVKKSVVLTAEDKKITNAVNHQAVVPQEKRIAKVNLESCIAKLAPLSFNMVRIGL